jgi:hypothetical protein
MTRTEAVAEQERLFPRLLMRQYVTTDVPHHNNRYQLLPPTLPEIVLDLRSALNGSADPWPAEQVKEVMDMLQARLDTWDHNVPVPMTEEFWFRANDQLIDGYVRALVFAGVAMARMWLIKQEG